MTGTMILCIVIANVLMWPAARRLARWMIARELARDLRRSLDAWGVDDARR